MNAQAVLEPTIPDGYMQRADGSLVRTAKVKAIDIERNDLVNMIVGHAIQLSATLKRFKQYTFADIAAFISLSAEAYDTKIGGNKGNVTLYSFDGRYKIQRNISEHIRFDEKMQAAKVLIDECLTDWTQHSSDNLKVIVNKAFDVNKDGNVSTARVLSLRKLEITDTKWERAMDAISDSINIVGSKAYIRIYERVGDTDQYKPISLDLATL